MKQFKYPFGMSVDSKRNVIRAADSDNGRIVIMNLELQHVRSLTGSDQFQLEKPWDVCAEEGSDILFVVDWMKNRVLVVTETGKHVRDFGEEGKNPGQLHRPSHHVNRSPQSFVRRVLMWKQSKSTIGEMLASTIVQALCPVLCVATS